MSIAYILVATIASGGVVLALTVPEPYLPFSARTLRRALIQIGREPPTLNQLSLLPRMLLKVPVSTLARVVNGVLPESHKDAIKRRLLLARLNEHLSVAGFVHLRIASALVACFYFTILGITSGDPLFWWFTLGAMGIGIFIPDQWLNIKVNRRRRSIHRELPAMLSALAIVTEAGLVLGGAIAEVGRTRTGVLAEELRWAAAQMNLGVPQAVALEEMAARCDVPELTQVISSLVQSFERGSHQVVSALRAQASEAWAARKRKAEEMAQQASIKLFLPLLLMVFPALMIFLLGPAAMLIMELFSQPTP